MNRSELKALAKVQIKGRIGVLFVCMLLVTLAGSISSVIPVVGYIAYLLFYPALMVGYNLVHYNLANGQEPKVEDLFSRFSSWSNAFVYSIVNGLFVFLWSLLFIIPGIVKALSYSMGYYILIENPEMSGMEALNKSKEIMHGHKMELFLLYLSFVGWTLLSVLACGIPLIYVGPYMNQTLVNFYLNIKPQEKVIETEVVF